MRIGLYFLILLTMVFACSKQKPSDLQPDYIDSTAELERGEACQKLDLTKDLLELTNSKNLFKCTTWDKNFPNLYSALETVDTQKWNYITAPINQKFLNDKTNRDLIINIVQEMDSKGGLDEFAKVITALSDSNFFGHVSEIFDCADQVGACRGEQVSREDISNFFKFFHLKKADLERANKVITNFVKILNATDMSFFKALSKDLSSKAFINARYDLFNQFILKFRKDDIKDEVEFLRNIFNGKNANGKSRIVELVTKNMTGDDFQYLMDYSAVKEPDQWKEFRVLNALLKTDIVCEGFVGDRAMSVNVADHLNMFIKELFLKDREYFFSQSIESLGVLKTAQSLCDKFSFYEKKIINPLTYETEVFSLNYVKAVSKTTRLLMLSSYYQLFDYLQEAVPNHIENKELFLIKFFSSDFHVSFVELVSVLNEIDSGLVASLYDLLGASGDEFIEDVVYFLDWFLEKDQKEISALGKVWAAFSKEGQFFFFNFIDSHYKEDVDIRLLFSFYNSLLNNFIEEVASILDNYFSHTQSMDAFLASMQEITNKLGGESLIDDYRNFFSRDHFIEMIKIISRGQIEQVSQSYILTHSPNAKKPIGVQIDLSQVVRSDHERGQCIEDMNEKESDFYDLITNIPASCLPYVEENVFFNVIAEINKLGSYVNGTGNRWSNYSFFSSDMMKSGTLLLNYLSEEYKSIDGEGVTSIVSDFQRYVDDGGRKANLLATLELVEMLNSVEDDSVLSAFLKYYSTNENFEYLEDVVMGVSDALSTGFDYHRGKLGNILSKTDFRKDQSYDCNKYNNQKLGSIPCPDLSKIKFIKNSLVSKLLKKNDNNPTALELLLTAILPDNGLLIPFDSTEQSKKRITFGETFMMIYDLTNTTLKVNKAEIEYQEIPQAVSTYFSEEWEIDKEMLDSAPDEKVVSMNTMERIETVIRDVRFDANYLGAHYMNAVAKAEVYDDTVDSKYSLLGMCVPLKFCGKFMNKAQHRLGRSAKRTFPGLIDVNKEEGWRYGDYMRALLQVVVASSPDDSQKSAVIDRRVLGVKISIPVLQSKKDLIYHNGKILSDLSMVSAFSNVGRLIRDRVGRSEKEFQEFITSARLKRFDSSFLRKVMPDQLVSFVKKIIIKGQENGYLDRLVQFFYKEEYQKQRLIENLAAKFSVMTTYLSDEALPTHYLTRYKNLNLLELEDYVHWAIENYNELAHVIPLENKEFLIDVNYLLDVVLYNLENKNQETLVLVNELFKFAAENKNVIIGNIEKIRIDQNLPRFKNKIAALPKLLKDLSDYDQNRQIVKLIAKLKNSGDVDFKAFQRWFAASSAREICYNQLCEKNIAYREINKTIQYIIENKSSRLFRSINYLAIDKKRDLDKLLRKIFSTLTIQ